MIWELKLFILFIISHIISLIKDQKVRFNYVKNKGKQINQYYTNS
jgi:hypothetical protein